MLDAIATRYSNTWTDAGLYAKLPSLDYWNHITDVVNTTGISFVGGGDRDLSAFGDLKSRGYYHCSTAFTASNVYGFNVYSATSDDIGYNAPSKKYGLSIRMVKDAVGITDGATTTYTGNDGKIYTAIAFNELYWTVKNLAETKYRNGTSISEVTDQTAWANLSTGARCVYNNDESNK